MAKYKIYDIIKIFEEFAPSTLQESYDNAGLIVGNPHDEVKGILICIDCIEEVVDEAINKKLNLIIAHHPIIFSGLKKINGKSYFERVIIKAIKNDISIYAVHTNADNVLNGVNYKIANLIGLKNISILSPKEEQLFKIVTFCPVKFADKVREALFNSGAGVIGNYDSCSFSTIGTGTFKAGKETNPFVGEKGIIHKEKEERIETIVTKQLLNQCIKNMISAHPYEEVAYDIYPLKNTNPLTGSGIIGELDEGEKEYDFLQKLKKIFKSKCIRHTAFLNKKIKKVAVCGGAGAFLLPTAISKGADIFISADFKYHQFFDADKKIIIADIGHYESEQFTKELFYDLIKEKFPNFAIHLTEVNTNPIKYF